MTDTMRPFGELISIAEARATVSAFGTGLTRIERVPLHEAHARVLARSIVASHDVPPFARAAMDGYAVRSTDTSAARTTQPVELRLVDAVYTGQTSRRTAAPGECIQVATGAPMPAGTDAVVMVEDTTREGDATVRVRVAVSPGQYVGAQGTDIRAGQAVMSPGTRLTAGTLGAVAATGTAAVDVFARPRVAVLSTGDEVVAPGQAIGPGQIHDVNQYTVGAVIREHGGVPVLLGTVPDVRDTLLAALDRGLAEDLVVASGGSSVGERDLIVDAVTARGRVLFHGIAVKPGKPTLFGEVDGTPVFGLSGYPTSCLIHAYVLVVPVLRRLANLPPHTPHRISMPLARAVKSVPARHQFLTVRVVEGQAVPTFKSSGDITSMSQATGYVEIPAEQTRLDAGTLVEVTCF